MALYRDGLAQGAGTPALWGMLMNIALWLRRTARAHPQRPALFSGKQQIASYAQFDHRAAQIAAGLTAVGIKAGDRIALYLKNIPEYMSLLYGACYAGAVVVPINAKLHPREAA